MVRNRFTCLLVIAAFSCAGCSSNSGAQLVGAPLAGDLVTESMTPRQMHAVIDVAHLDGQLSEEEARAAHQEIESRSRVASDESRLMKIRLSSSVTQ